MCILRSPLSLDCTHHPSSPLLVRSHPLPPHPLLLQKKVRLAVSNVVARPTTTTSSPSLPLLPSFSLCAESLSPNPGEEGAPVELVTAAVCHHVTASSSKQQQQPRGSYAAALILNQIHGMYLAAPPPPPTAGRKSSESGREEEGDHRLFINHTTPVSVYVWDSLLFWREPCRDLLCLLVWSCEVALERRSSLDNDALDGQ